MTTEKAGFEEDRDGAAVSPPSPRSARATAADPPDILIVGSVGLGLDRWRARMFAERPSVGELEEHATLLRCRRGLGGALQPFDRAAEIPGACGRERCAAARTAHGEAGRLPGTQNRVLGADRREDAQAAS